MHYIYTLFNEYLKIICITETTNLLSPLSLIESAFNCSRRCVSTLVNFGTSSMDAPDSRITSVYKSVLLVDLEPLSNI